MGIFSVYPIGLETNTYLSVEIITALTFVWIVICALANLIF